MTDDLKGLGRQFCFPATHHKGEPLLQVVYADPGMNGFYYRERMPDSVAAYVRADIHAAALDRIAELEGFIEEFASAKIDALHYSMPHRSSPEDEPDPVVDAETVWAYQEDARAVLTPAPTGQEGA